MKYSKTILATACLLSLCTALSSLEANPGASRQGSIPVEKNTADSLYPTLAKISLTQALEHGLKAQPGQPLRVELTEENGFLIYEVEIVAPDKKIYEVDIDAGNGQALKVELDN